jgi:repressor LexA
MVPADPRMILAQAAERDGVSLTTLSRVVGRNPAYVQQYVRRGSPRILPERERRILADYLGLAEDALGGPPGLRAVRAFDVAASAGPGGIVDIDLPERPWHLDPALLDRLGVRAGAASMIRVAGMSMAPTLIDGDEILVDGDRRIVPAGGGVFVLRLDDVLMVKRLRPDPPGVAVLSDNPAVEDWMGVARARVRVIGRVAWVSRCL